MPTKKATKKLNKHKKTRAADGPTTAKGNVKKLECPTCREVTEVKRGKAANLLKNFSLLC